MTKSTPSAKSTRLANEKFEKEIGDCLHRKWEENPELLVQSLFNYLTITPAGAEVLKRATLHHVWKLQQELAAPIDVALLMHNDGWLEIYAPPGVRPKAWTMPWWPISDEDGQYLVECTMPQRLGRLMWPHATFDRPGLVSSHHVCVKEVDRGSGPETLFTWRNCENQWRGENTKPTESPPSKEK